MKFKTQLSVDSGKYISESGSPLLAKYAMKIDKKSGYEYLAPTGEYENIYDRIQADYSSTDINVLMERFALGDTSAIDVKQGFYADVTKMPQTYAEMFQMGEDAKRYFQELPADLKEMFNNSYTEFYSEMDTKGFMDKINKYNERFDIGDEWNEPEPIKSEQKGEE